MNYISKSSILTPYLKATSTAVANQIRPIPAVVTAKEKVLFQAPTEKSSSYSLGCSLPKGKILARSGGIGSLSGQGQYRLAHTDIKVPDFSSTLHPDYKDPNKNSTEAADKRKIAEYVPAVVGGSAALCVGKSLVYTVVDILGPQADALALGKTEVDLNKIPEGVSMTFTWRGKPLFIKHRTAEDISREAGVALESLRDPQHDSERVQDPKWLVLIGVCTHLGCIPIADAGEFGGYFCPCHGSHYDGSGRIRKGPAPLNLEVPPYEIQGDVLIVG